MVAHRRRSTPAAPPASRRWSPPCVAILLIATGTFQRLVAIASFFLAVNYAVCCLALVVLRRREPKAARPFRAWGYPWSAAIVIAGALGFLVGAVIGDTTGALTATGVLVLGLAWFFGSRHRR